MRIIVGCILTITILFGMSPVITKATAHYPHTKTIGCSRLGYRMAVPTAWKVTTNCAKSTIIEGGNPRFTIAITADAHIAWTTHQASADCTRLLKYLGSLASTYKIGIKPEATTVAGRQATWALGTYVMKDAGREFAEVYEVYSAGILHRFLFTADYSGGSKAGTDATSNISDMIASLTIR